MQTLKQLMKTFLDYDGNPKDLYPPLVKATNNFDFLGLAKLLYAAPHGRSNPHPDLEQEAITPAQYALRPIHFAADLGGDAASAAVLTMLLQTGADPNAKSRHVQNWENPFECWTPLYMVVELGQHAAALSLLNWLANSNVDCGGWYPLHRAAQKNDALMINILASHQANINAISKTREAWTPLHLAAVSGATKACKALWYEGADIDISDADGKTALALASEKGHDDTARLLGALGANDMARALYNVTDQGKCL